LIAFNFHTGPCILAEYFAFSAKPGHHQPPILFPPETSSCYFNDSFVYRLAVPAPSRFFFPLDVFLAVFFCFFPVRQAAPLLAPAFFNRVLWQFNAI